MTGSSLILTTNKSAAALKSLSTSWLQTDKHRKLLTCFVKAGVSPFLHTRVTLFSSGSQRLGPVTRGPNEDSRHCGGETRKTGAEWNCPLEEDFFVGVFFIYLFINSSSLVIWQSAYLVKDYVPPPGGQSGRLTWKKVHQIIKRRKIMFLPVPKSIIVLLSLGKTPSCFNMGLFVHAAVN